MMNTHTSTIEQAIGAGRAVAILFTAPWCAAGTIIEHILLTEHLGGTALAVINIENDPHLADRFKIVSLPTLIWFAGTYEQGRLLGAFSAAFAIDSINKSLKQPASAISNTQDGKESVQ
jgi:thioredoxin-like negative regulator of GroEL